jgi:hypothetical protein
VDGNQSLSFRRRWLILFIVGTAEFHVLPFTFGVGGMAFTLANLDGEWWIPLLLCCFFWLPLAAFGAIVFVSKFGPPLLSLVVGEWPSEMPEAIGEYVGVEVERLGDIDKAVGGIGEIPG